MILKNKHNKNRQYRNSAVCNSTYLKGKLQHPGPHHVEGQRMNGVPLKVVQEFHMQQVDRTAFWLR
jgi:hypothetical protein